MEDLGENTTVLSTLRSLNNFISQRVEGGSGLDVSTSAQGSLQMQYEQCLCLEEHTEQIRSDLPHIPDREGKDASGSKG